MPTVIDSLIVKLGLDPKGFTSGQKQAAASMLKTRQDADATAKQLEAAGKRGAEFFNRMRSEALKLAAVLVGGAGVYAFVQRLNTADAALGRFAKNTGLSANELAAFEQASLRLGGSADATRGSIRSISQELERLAVTGNTEILRPLNLTGVELAKFVDKATPMADKIGMISDALKKVSDQQGRTRALFLAGQMGIDEGTFNLLVQGNAALQQQLSLVKALGLTTEKDVKAAQDLVTAFHDLSQVVYGVLREAFTEISPILTQMMKDLREFIQANKQDISAKIKEFGNWLRAIDWKGVKDGLKDFWEGIEKVTGSVGGLVKVVEALFGLWLGAKFAAVLGAVAGLSGGTLLAVGGTALAAIWAIDKLTGGAVGRHGADLNAGLINPDTMDPTNRLIYGDPKGSVGVGENASDPGAPRGVRNNNPLNLGYRADQPGVIGTDGRFGKYRTMEEGVASNHRQLLMHQKQREKNNIPNTLENIITRWAPPSENDTAGYISQVSKQTGYRANQVLDMNDPQVANTLMRAMARKEIGRDLDPAMVGRGVGLSRGVTDLGGVGAGMSAGVGGGGSTTTITQEVTVNGGVNVHGTDPNNAQSVGQGIKRGLQDRTYVPQMNYGQR